MAGEKAARQLDDLDLDTVSGGTTYSAEESKVVHSRSGKEIGTVIDGTIWYTPCPKCGRPTYSEWLCAHCDPCNDYWFWSSSVSSQPWYGTRQSLIDAFG